ncbi:MAG: hypothetical protein WAX14_21220 [Rhodococcus sp. (in: high G+C Gram-positive bacteria)]|uniref:hypothetical protein n=1 Tax=Rhodococcus sp. TaxID=1831 RepID=UPI003BB6E7C5
MSGFDATAGNVEAVTRVVLCRCSTEPVVRAAAVHGRTEFVQQRTVMEDRAGTEQSFDDCQRLGGNQPGSKAAATSECIRSTVIAPERSKSRSGSTQVTTSGSIQVTASGSIR